MCGQSAQPDACHMDSDGFCVSGGVQSAPILGPVPRNDLPVSSSPVPQDMLKGGSSSTLQGKLQVELRNDLLQIDAENVTLRDALKAVSARTGAEIQFPPGGLEEHIFAHLGPASPRDVVSQLLKGVQFNYVILSSPSEPRGITRLILSRASGTGESTAPDATAITASEPATPQLYGAAFGAEPDAIAVEPVPTQVPGPNATSAAIPAASWIHNDGPKLSGEYLDQMQKAQIQQEQQQLAQQAQQQRQPQQQEQPAQTSPPQ